jgi:signal transduction histidine kinase
LRRALATLQNYDLPPEGKAAVQQALRSVAELSQTLGGKVEQQDRLSALYQVSQILGTSLQLDEVLNQVMDAVIGLTGAERGMLMMVEAETGELRVRAARNVAQGQLEQDDMTFSRTVIQTVMETGEGVVTTNAQEDPRFAGEESVIAFGLRSILCAPLRARSKTIGAIYVDNRARAGLFTPEDLDLLNAFAAQAAAAIDNANLFTQTDQSLAARVAELEELARIVRKLNTSLDIQEVARIATQWAMQGTEAVRGWLALQDGSAAFLEVVFGDHTEETIPATDELVAGTLQAGTPHVFPPDDGQPGRLVAPLLADNQTIGVLAVEKGGSFSQQSLQFLTRIANHASLAISKARLYRDVQAANEDKSNFVSVVSHELRLPMTSILGYTDLLKGGQVGEVNQQQVEFLNVIRNNAERMSLLVSDLSDISKIEVGRLHLEPAMVALHGYVQEALTSLRPKLDEKRQAVDVRVPESLPRVYADPNRLTQILTNLISNASKYTPENGKIAVQAQAKDGYVRVTVQDSGIGISEEDQANLFTQFFRSEAAQVREEDGWGLGLSVAKRLVELMGGEIGAESQLGVGSIFWFTLPTRQLN